MFQFNFLVEKYVTDLKEGREPKTSQYSNIELDASEFVNKLNNGDLNELIQAWSTKTWLGGWPAETIRKLLDSIAEDLVEYPPSSYTELWTQVENKTRDVTKRKDLIQKITRVISNLLTDPAYGLTKTVEAPTHAEPEVPEKSVAETHDLSDIAEKAYNFINQAEEPSTYADVIQYITSSFAKEESEAESAIKELIDNNLVEKVGDHLRIKEDHGSAILNTDADADDDEDATDDIRRNKTLEYDPDVAAAYKEYLGSNDNSDNLSYGD